MIGYWYDIINSDNKLSLILYRLILQDNVHNGHSYECLLKLFSMTVDLLIFGRVNSSTVLSRIETTLLPQFKQKWWSDVNNSSKCFLL